MLFSRNKHLRQRDFKIFRNFTDIRYFLTLFSFVDEKPLISPLSYYSPVTFSQADMEILITTCCCYIVFLGISSIYRCCSLISFSLIAGICVAADGKRRLQEMKFTCYDKLPSRSYNAIGASGTHFDYLFFFYGIIIISGPILMTRHYFL